MEWAGEPVVTGTTLPLDDDGHLVIGMDAASEAARAELAKLRSAVRVQAHEYIELFEVRRTALDFASRGAAGAALPLTVVERAQAFEQYLLTGRCDPEIVT